MKSRAGQLLAVLVLCLSLFLPGCNGGGGIANQGPNLNHEACKDGVCLRIEAKPPFIVQQQSPVTITVTSNVDFATLTVGLAGTGVAKVAKGTSWKFPIQAGEQKVLQGNVLFVENGYGKVGAVVWDPNSFGGSVVVSQDLRVLVNPNGGEVDPVITPDILPHWPTPPQNSSESKDFIPIGLPKIDGYTPEELLWLCNWEL